MTTSSRDLTRTLLILLSVGALIGASLWILRPFLLPALWATTMVVATWPLMLWVQARFRGRRRLAVAAMAVLMLLVFLVPCALAAAALAGNSDRIVGWVRSLATSPVPPPPAFLSRIPWLGEQVADFWNGVAVRGIGSLMPYLEPYADDAARWLLSAAGSAGYILVQVLLTIAIAILLYAKGEAAASGAVRFAERLMGPDGGRMVLLAGQTIRGVALGVVVTAIVQALLAGIGLAVCGVPLVPLLTTLSFFLALAQIGAFPVLLLAAAWLYGTGHPGWGTALLVWALPVGTVDNVLRPILIRRGADLPLVLVFSGVVGGLLAFGVVGIFVGPVVLAVCRTLLREWTSGAPDSPESDAGAPGAKGGVPAEA